VAKDVAALGAGAGVATAGAAIADAVTVVVATVVVAIAGAGVVAAMRARPRNGCLAPSWAAWYVGCSRAVAPPPWKQPR